jgi:hypothetical protein
MVSYSTLCMVSYEGGRRWRARLLRSFYHPAHFYPSVIVIRSDMVADVHQVHVERKSGNFSRPLLLFITIRRLFCGPRCDCELLSVVLVFLSMCFDVIEQVVW